MIAATFRAMGTSWWIHCDRVPLLASAQELVRELEARLSRFREGSDLSRLNRRRELESPVLAGVTRRALVLQHATGGAFDPTLGAELVALGYDRSFAALARIVPRGPTRPGVSQGTTVEVTGDHLRLVGPGALDLGGIAKGYAVDRVVEHLLDGGASAILVDGGGELRGAGPSYPIGVGDGLVLWSHLGAVATSSTRRRRWLGEDGEVNHHIIDPGTGRSSAGRLDIATVVASDTATADGLATALLASPDRVLPLLSTLGAHALVRARDGAWWMTPGSPFGDAPAPGDGAMAGALVSSASSGGRLGAPPLSVEVDLPRGAPP